MTARRHRLGDYQVRVTITFAEIDGDRTRVEIAEDGWHDSEAGRRASYGNCMDWAQMFAAHGVGRARHQPS